jgi:hypothetical protein
MIEVKVSCQASLNLIIEERKDEERIKKTKGNKGDMK